MSRQAMERALSEVPGKHARVLEDTRPYLLEVADRLQDDILGILQASAAYLSYMCLVVTPTRIIGVGQQGSVEVWHYKDVTQVTIVGGKKKLLGGHDQSFFLINLPDGGNLTFQLFGDNEYTHRVGLRAEQACRRAQIARLLSIRPGSGKAPGCASWPPSGCGSGRGQGRPGFQVGGPGSPRVARLPPG